MTWVKRVPIDLPWIKRIPKKPPARTPDLLVLSFTLGEKNGSWGKIPETKVTYVSLS